MGGDGPWRGGSGGERGRAIRRIDSETKDKGTRWREKNKQKELCANDESATNEGERLRKMKKARIRQRCDRNDGNTHLHDKVGDMSEAANIHAFSRPALDKLHKRADQR